MSSIVEKKKLVKGRVVLIRKSVVESINNVKGLFATGIKIVEHSLELDITKSVTFKLISRTKSENR